MWTPRLSEQHYTCRWVFLIAVIDRRLTGCCAHYRVLAVALYFGQKGK
jgi:hypothetical protein